MPFPQTPLSPKKKRKIRCSIYKNKKACRRNTLENAPYPKPHSIKHVHKKIPIYSVIGFFKNHFAKKARKLIPMS